MHREGVALACLASVFSSAAAQADSDFQAWSALAISGPVSEDSRVLAWFDGHARFRDDASDLGVSIIRPAIGWRATDRLDLWAGYARVVSRADGRANIEEDRAWQQATYPIASVFGGGLSGRTRFEQRFRGDLGDDTGLRVRQFVRWARPIEGTSWSYVAANETFIGLNDTDWGQRDGFDQNRAFLGLAWRAAPKARLEFGYLNNHINGVIDDQTNHNVSAALFCQLELTGAESAENGRTRKRLTVSSRWCSASNALENPISVARSGYARPLCLIVYTYGVDGRS